MQTPVYALMTGPQSWTVLEAREAEPGEESDVSSPALQGVVAPSILASDFSRLAEEVQACMQSGAQWVHVDVSGRRVGCAGECRTEAQSPPRFTLHMPCRALSTNAAGV